MPVPLDPTRPVAPQSAPQPTALEQTEPRRLLVVRLGAIGDVVNALVFATAVKRERPDVHVAWVVHELARPLVEGHPHVDRVHVWRRGSGFRGLRALAEEMRAEQYDLAVDLQRILKSAIVARASAAPRVLGYDRKRAKEFSWLLALDHVEPGPRNEHMALQYLAFARHLGCDGPVEHHLPIDSEAAAWADAVVSELGAPPVLVNAGASKPKNRWSPERFAEVVRVLLADGTAPVVVIGGPGDRELAAPLITAGGERVRDLVGATSLRQLAALLARSRLLLTGDTGPMHLAVAVGAPTLALFGPADAHRTGPFGWSESTDSMHTVLFAPRGVMGRLGADAVVTAVRAKLSLDTTKGSAPFKTPNDRV